MLIGLAQCAIQVFEIDDDVVDKVTYSVILLFESTLYHLLNIANYKDKH